MRLIVPVCRCRWSRSAFQRASIDKITAAAVRGGMRTLVDDGKIKILRGVTTPKEVARFAQAEHLLEANVDI